MKLVMHVAPPKGYFLGGGAIHAGRVKTAVARAYYSQDPVSRSALQILSPSKPAQDRKVLKILAAKISWAFCSATKKQLDNLCVCSATKET